jgi:hypothetical protein
MKTEKYYRQIWAPTGVDVDIFEKELGKWLEAKAPMVFDKLINTHDALTEDEATTLLLSACRKYTSCTAGPGLLRPGLFPSAAVQKPLL